MLLPLPLGAEFDSMTLELPLNVTAASLRTYIAPPLSCNERKKKTREKFDRYSKEEEKKRLDMLIHKKIRKIEKKYENKKDDKNINLINAK